MTQKAYKVKVTKVETYETTVWGESKADIQEQYDSMQILKEFPDGCFVEESLEFIGGDE